MVWFILICFLSKLVLVVVVVLLLLFDLSERCTLATRCLSLLLCCLVLSFSVLHAFFIRCKILKIERSHVGGSFGGVYDVGVRGTKMSTDIKKSTRRVVVRRSCKIKDSFSRLKVGSIPSCDKEWRPFLLHQILCFF